METRNEEDGSAERPYTVAGPTDRGYKFCRCSECKEIGLCTPNSDYWGNDGEPLLCEPCFDAWALRSTGATEIIEARREGDPRGNA